jgi:hypothetical protein
VDVNKKYNRTKNAFIKVSVLVLLECHFGIVRMSFWYC